MAELRQNLMTEKTFSATFNKFFDIVEGDPTFMGRGQKSKNKKVLELVSTMLGLFFKIHRGALVISQLQYVENTIDNMFHGSGMVKGHLFVFFYFSDLDKGMLSINKMGSSHNTIVRITSEPVSHIKTDDLSAN